MLGWERYTEAQFPKVVSMKAILDLVARHKAGKSCGIASICSAHPLVIEATLVCGAQSRVPLLLIEATCNQVNQDGGYTGMKPADFRDFVFAIADKTGVAHDRILLGGDHLGPNPWTSLPADEAMAKAEVMVEAYVAAGFRKIHADCSMACSDDPVPVPEDVIARRAARLIAIAEKTWKRVGGEAPVYVIGTEVPVPGGATEDLPELEVTAPAAALATIKAHQKIFAELGLAEVWPRVVATVVQPGVEFDHHKVVDYNRAKAVALSKAIETVPTLLFEAHSTDYQTPKALAELVEDHFAILKVGPGLTFALREAYWALDAIEHEWLEKNRSEFRRIALTRMQENPKHWAKYYQGDEHSLKFDMQYSLSDRIRYYWPDAEIVRAEKKLFDNLAANPPPPSLVSQHMPDAFAALRKSGQPLTPANLIRAHIGAVLEGYFAATQPVTEFA
jgi:D-tagatose-1,6-bisphosphate aldolase subunit GatZ/KbaZ